MSRLFVDNMIMGVVGNVIPAKAGIQKLLKLLDPRLRGDDKSAFPTTPIIPWRKAPERGRLHPALLVEGAT
jgi:hypothetical protein